MDYFIKFFNFTLPLGLYTHLVTIRKDVIEPSCLMAAFEKF